MVNFCAFAGCSNSNLSGHKTHSFPKKKGTPAFRAWVRFVQLKRADFTASCVKVHSVLCSAHFKDDDYIQGDLMEHKMGFRTLDRVRLVSGAVPSIRSPSEAAAITTSRGSTAQRKLGLSRTLQSLCATVGVSEEPMVQEEDAGQSSAEPSIPPSEPHGEHAAHKATQYSFRRPHRSLGIQAFPQLLSLGTQAAPKMVSVETQTELSSFAQSPLFSQQSQCTISQSGSEQSTDFLRVIVCKEEFSPEQQERSPSLVQDERDPPQFTFSEDDENLPVASTSAEHMTTLADVEDYGTSQPTSDDQFLSSLLTQSDTEFSDTNSDVDWTETWECLSASNKLDSHKTHADMTTHTGEKPFTCPVCGKGFGFHSKLLRHMTTHTGEKPFTCTFCGRSFSDKGNMQKHVKTHSGVKPFICSVCGKGCGAKDHLATHMRTHTGDASNKPDSHETQHADMTTHTGDKSFTCPVCGKGFVCHSKLLRHMTTHTGEKPFTCTFCGKSFSHKGNMQTHVKVHSGVKPFICSICGKGCRAKDHLVTHMRTHTGEASNEPDSHETQHVDMTSHTGEKSYTCPFCGKGFGFRSKLLRHVTTHTGEKPFTCTFCGKSFSDKGNMQKHVKMHSGVNPFICSVCGKGCGAKDHLVTHMMTHTGEASNKPDSHETQHGKGRRPSLSSKSSKQSHSTRSDTGKKRFNCVDCGKGFSTQGWVRQHMTTHTGEKAFTCAVCGKGFGCHSKLLRHMTTHTGDKTFTCTFCGKGFNDKGNMQKHVKIHSGAKPFICSVCGKGCGTKNHLVIHMRTHTGEKPLICIVCGKRWHNTFRLNLHMRIHTGEKPYTCTVCERTFARKDYLDKHMRSHTGEKPFTCTICGKCYREKSNLNNHMKTHTGIKV